MRGSGTMLAVRTGVLVFLLLQPFATAGAKGGPEGFVRELTSTARSALGGDEMSAEERRRRFRGLLIGHFDIPGISRFVLGRYWRTASEPQRTEFMALFEKFTVQAYANRFRDIADARVTLLRSRKKTSTGQALVLSRIELPDREPFEVAWRVKERSSGYGILDVVIEGVSMRITLRDEFAAVIRSNGGKVEGLLAALRKKTED